MENRPYISNTPDTPNGIGGWLILVAISIILGPIRLILGISQIMQIFEPANWSAITTVGSPIYHPLWAPLLYFEVVYNFLVLILSIILIFLFFMKKAIVPKLLIGLYSCSIIFVLIDFLLSSSIITSLNLQITVYDSIKSQLQAIVTGAEWIPYFIFSKRVKNTFVQ